LESLRIAMVSDWFLPRVGGVEVSIHELAHALGMRGHEVFVVTHGHTNTKGSQVLEDGDHYIVYRIPSPLNVKDDVTLDPLAVARSVLFIKRNAFDLVHSHGISSTLSLVTSMVASGGIGVPSVLTNHSLISNDLPPGVRRLLKYGLKWPTVLTGVSRAASHDVEVISGRNSRLTPNCIDVNKWREAASSQRLEGDPAVIITSRLSRRKNPLEIARVAELVLRRLPRAVFYVIGDGVLSADLRKLIASRGLEGHVRLLGTRPRHEVAKMLSGADFFALTSYRESFGLAVLEAMALGLVPVVYRSPGVLDLVEDGQSGFVVDDATSMAEAIANAYEDQALFRSASRASVERARLFDCQAVIDSYVLSVYREALNSCSQNDRRFLVYRLYRRLVGDPVRPGEWCSERKWRYHERAKEGLVPVVRRRA